MKCHFCDQSAEFGCTWPETKFVEVRVSNIWPGDRVRRLGDGRPRFATVVERHMGIETDLVVLEIKRKDGRVQEKRFVMQKDHVMQAERNLVCGLPVCERHVVDRDEKGQMYCRDHWHAWEQVA